MAKISSVNGITFDGDALKNHATGKVYLGGTEIKNKATGENYHIKDIKAKSKDALYATLRDDSWLPMIEPMENEIYMLMHLYGESSFIAFSVTGDEYKVEIGTVKNGEFVPDESKTETVNSGTVYENRLYSSDFADEMPDGGKQCMIKVSSPRIQYFNVSPHSDHINSKYLGWHVTEIWANVPDAVRFKLWDTTRNSMRFLQFLKISNNSSIRYCTLDYLYSLRMVLELDVMKTPLEFLGANCTNLVYIPKLSFSTSGSMNGALTSCAVIRPEFENFDKVVYMSSNTFSNNVSLEEIVGLNTCNVITDICITNCTNLKKLEIDTSSTKGVFKADNDYSLNSLTFKSSTGNSPTSISAINTNLQRDALCRMFDSLEYTDTPKTVTITGATGANELTESDIDIAMTKGWSVVI